MENNKPSKAKRLLGFNFLKPIDLINDRVTN